MPDLSGVSQTGLELLLEFDGDYTDTSSNNRDQTSFSGPELFADDGAIEEAAKFSNSQLNFINTGVTGWSTATMFAGPANPWTWATWIRFAGESSSGAGVLVSRQILQGSLIVQNQSRIFSVVVHTNRDKITVLIRGAETVYDFNMQDGDWHHVAVTWDNTTPVVWLDGELQVTPGVGSLAEYPVNLVFGATGTQLTGEVPISRLNGQLDDLRVYSRALNSAEIALLFGYGGGGGGIIVVEPDDLELYLEFEEDFLDSSINLRHQTANVTGSPTFPSGKIGAFSSRWSGSSQYIKTGVTALGAASLFAAAGEVWSTFAWVRRQTGDTGGCVIARDDVLVNEGGFRMFVDFAVSEQVHIHLAGQNNIYNFTGLHDGNWHSICVVWDDTAGFVYLDGLLQTAPTEGADPEGTIHIVIAGLTSGGSGSTPIQQFDGDIDGLRVYSRALQQEDVDAIQENEGALFDVVLSIVSVTGATASIRVDFDRDIDPASLTLGDFTISNGTASNLATVTNAIYTFDVTAVASGIVTVQLAESTVDDGTGAENGASNIVSFGVTVGGDDGILRFDRTESREDQTANIIIGPIAMSPDAMHKSLMRTAKIILGNDTDATGTVKFSAGTDGQDAVARAEGDDHQYTVTLATLLANNGMCFPQLAGHALVIEIDVTEGHCIFEQGVLPLEPAGHNNNPRYS